MLTPEMSITPCRPPGPAVLPCRAVEAGLFGTMYVYARMHPRIHCQEKRALNRFFLQKNVFFHVYTVKKKHVWWRFFLKLYKLYIWAEHSFPQRCFHNAVQPGLKTVSIYFLKTCFYVFPPQWKAFPQNNGQRSQFQIVSVEFCQIKPPRNHLPYPRERKWKMLMLLWLKFP